MEFLPMMKLGWLNGWIPLVVFYLPFGLLMLIWPKDIVKKLYAVSGWSKTERIMSLAGKPFALTCLMDRRGDLHIGFPGDVRGFIQLQRHTGGRSR
jgi:hypothetical protein